ncbi:uncharacterized protein LOC125047735 [Penaeus chinensis]|uniref:uncharacterized protein LOC125047735 n=1 Tax=Penaeus chinensis TaxID=139456 RepID=UPI001FB64225|nr:uncharacterized protein LOC125047735 [Penaeus chinensis]
MSSAKRPTMDPAEEPEDNVPDDEQDPQGSGATSGEKGKEEGGRKKRKSLSPKVVQITDMYPSWEAYTASEGFKNSTPEQRREAKEQFELQKMRRNIYGTRAPNEIKKKNR